MKKSMAKNYHLLAIDLGEVLLSVDHASTYRRLALLTNLSAQEVQRRLDDDPIIHALDRGEVTPERFAAAVSAKLDCVIDTHTLRRCWTGILGVKHDVVTWLEALMPRVIDAVRARATVGEISDRLSAVWGAYRPGE